MQVHAIHSGAFATVKAVAAPRCEWNATIYVIHRHTLALKSSSDTPLLLSLVLKSVLKSLRSKVTYLLWGVHFYGILSHLCKPRFIYQTQHMFIYS